MPKTSQSPAIPSNHISGRIPSAIPCLRFKVLVIGLKPIAWFQTRRVINISGERMQNTAELLHHRNYLKV